MMRKITEAQDTLADLDGQFLRLRHFLKKAPKPDEYVSEYGQWYRRLQQVLNFLEAKPDFFVQLRDGTTFESQKELALFLTQQERGTVEYCDYCHIEAEPTSGVCDNPFCTLESTGAAGLLAEESDE